MDAALFDVDGTLIDSVDLHAGAWQDALRKWGKDVEFAAVRSQIGKGGDELMKVFLTAAEIRDFGEELSAWRGERFKEAYLPRVKPFPRVRELFKRILADDIRIVLASSATEEELKEFKRIAGIADLIDDATSSDDAKRSKPHPDIFQAALERSGATADTAVALGDTPYDVIAAKGAGLRTIGFLCGGFPEESLRQEGCIAVYRDPADLLARYDDSPLRRMTAPA